MRTISKEELEKILESHRHWCKCWLKGDASEVDKMYADLSRTDLSGVDLSGANLRDANLNEADLSGANLRGADLRDASLIRANLKEADLKEANFSMANLYGADLSEALFYETDFTEAFLHTAILSDPEYMNAICPLTCPDTGAFIGWKKADTIMHDESGFLDRVQVIVKLQIPACAKRSSATGRKCRCDKALVLDIQTIDGVSLKGTIAHSFHDFAFTYEVGKKLYIEDFDDDRWNECSTGIHFFITRQEAIDY